MSSKLSRLVVLVVLSSMCIGYTFGQTCYFGGTSGCLAFDVAPGYIHCRSEGDCDFIPGCLWQHIFLDVSIWTTCDGLLEAETQDVDTGLIGEAGAYTWWFSTITHIAGWQDCNDNSGQEYDSGDFCL